MEKTTKVYRISIMLEELDTNEKGQIYGIKDRRLRRTTLADAGIADEMYNEIIGALQKVWGFESLKEEGLR